MQTNAYIRAIRRCGTASAIALTSMVYANSAHAEHLIYVTTNHIGEIDSAAPSVDITPDGPLSYALPGGYVTIGADVHPGSKLLYLVARNASTSRCQLFSIAPSAGDPAPVAIDSSYACTSAAADFDVLAEDYAVYEYVLAAGTSIIDVLHDNGDDSNLFSAASLPATSTGGSDAALVATADDGHTVYGVDRGTASLVKLDVNFSNDAPTSVSEKSALPLSVPLTGSTSLDISLSSHTMYLMTGGAVYQLSTASGSASRLGAVPAGAVAVVAEQGLDAGGSAQLQTSAGPVTIVSSAGSIEAHTVATPDFAPPEYAYDLGFFSYDISGLTPGQSVTVTFTIPDGVEVDRTVKCNTDTCGEYSTEINGRKITLTLVDGGSGDDDGQVNGHILDPLAFVRGTDSSGGSSDGGGSSDDGTSNGDNGGAMSLLSSLGLGVFAALRRRRVQAQRSSALG